MKKQFRLQNLDCANCAAKLERKLKKIDGVDDVSVNFMTLKMIIEGADDKMDYILDEAYKTIEKFDSNIVIKRA